MGPPRTYHDPEQAGRLLAELLERSPWSEADLKDACAAWHYKQIREPQIICPVVHYHLALMQRVHLQERIVRELYQRKTAVKLELGVWISASGDGLKVSMSRQPD